MTWNLILQGQNIGEDGFVVIPMATQDACLATMNLLNSNDKDINFPCMALALDNQTGTMCGLPSPK